MIGCSGYALPSGIRRLFLRKSLLLLFVGGPVLKYRDWSFRSSTVSNGPYFLEGSIMKITDIKIEVVKRDFPAAGLNSDLGRFSGTTEQGVL